MGIEELKKQGVKGEFKEGAHGCFIYFVANDHYTTCVSRYEAFPLGYGTLVFIPDEPEELNLKKLDQALAKVKEAGTDLVYAEAANKEGRRITQAVLP